MKRATPNQTKPKAPPRAYKPNPVPMVLQAKKLTTGQPWTFASPTAPPPYHPQPKPKVLQTKTVSASPASSGLKVQTVQPKTLSAIRTAPAAPPVYRPQPKARVLQAKQIAQRRSSANTVQLAELSKADKRRLKEKAIQAGKEKSKEKKVQKTADNIVAYSKGNVSRAEASAAARSGRYVPGHHSDPSGNMNAGTAKAMAEFYADRRAAAAVVGGGGGDDDRPGGGGGGGGGGGDDGGGGPVAVTYEEVQTGAIKAWNRAVDAGESGLDAMTTYLRGRFEREPLEEEWENEILESWADSDPRQKLPLI
jgi:hypothetical protein